MYDVVVIGAGPGGYVCAIKSAQLGLKVAVVEREHAGGTCTNKGCIPTKALLSVSHLFHELKAKARRFGINAENVSYNFPMIKKHMERSIITSRKGVEYLLKKNKIDYIKGTATVVSPNKVKVGDTFLEAKNLVIATGSVPTVFHPFDEIPGIWTSDDFFEMEKLPESILIVGGGVVGVELATFLSIMGTDVHIVEIMDHVLPNEDSDVAEVVRRSLNKLGVKILESSKVISIDKEERYMVTIDTPKERVDLVVEKILLAVGRRPLIGDDVRALGVRGEKGILTDEHLRTDVENVYAVGDVRGKVMLAHAAFHEGAVAAKNIAGNSVSVDLSAVPSVIFSYPEVASVGLREKDVNTDEVKISKFPVSASGRANTMGEREGFVKVLSDRKTGTVLGVTIVCPMATEMIMEGVVAVKKGLTVEEMASLIHPHPTLSETILGAFEEAEGKAIHL